VRHVEIGPWSGRLRLNALIRFAGHPVNALTIRLLGFQVQPEFLPNHRSQETAHRMRLPANGVPFIFWNIGMQMIQQPDRIIILYSNDNESRVVRLNAPHPPHVTPSWHGDSVGHYEGGTLVIDTVGIKADRPFAMVDMYGTPHSEALHVVERYRLLDHDAAQEAEQRGENGNFRLPQSDTGFAPDPNYKGNGLELQFTVEDDGVFATPWSAAIVYQRPISSLGEWPEFVCADNRHEYYSGKDTNAPRGDKPDF
jgi:hypothetical protein